MDREEEKIIELVEVISEGKPVSAEPQDHPPQQPDLQLTPEWEEKIADLVHREVERQVQLTVQGRLDNLVREVLAREAEKALAREIEALKKA
jgi:hypothetical protein